MHILLTEDDMTTQLALRRMLERQGFSVDVADDGFECLMKIISNHYDVVLMDILLPYFNGIQTAMIIREMERAQKKCIHIIAISASMSFVCEEIKGYSLFDGQLSKPFEIEELTQMIKSIT